MKAFRTILKVIGIIVFAAVVILYGSLLVPRFFGIECYSIISGSMEPEIPVGSMVYARMTACEEVQPGDIIVFGDGADLTMTPVTHRVIENHVEDQEFITKGDANEQEDLRPVSYGRYLGTVSLHLPYIGTLGQFLTTGSGKVGSIILLIGSFLLMILP